MKQIFILIFFFCMCTCFAQTVKKGTVLLQNSNNQKLAAVRIKVLEAAQTQSDTDGVFTLVFEKKEPIESIIIEEIALEGYEVVNQKEVLLSSYLSEPLTIVLSPVGKMAKNKEKYYQIAFNRLNETKTQQLNKIEKELAESQIDMLTYRTKLYALNTNFLQQYKLVETFANNLAHYNFDEACLVHQQAFNAFQKGAIDQAIQILETVKSGNELIAAQKIRDTHQANSQQVEQADKTIQQHTEKLYFQAQLYALSNRYSEYEVAHQLPNALKIYRRKTTKTPLTLEQLNDVYSNKNIRAYAPYLAQRLVEGN